MTGWPSALVHSCTNTCLSGFCVRVSAPASSRSCDVNRRRWFILPPVSGRHTHEPGCRDKTGQRSCETFLKVLTLIVFQRRHFLSATAHALHTSRKLTLDLQPQALQSSDYGSLYGMGSYYGPDYTAATLVNLATATQSAIALARCGKPLTTLGPDEAAASRAQMQRELKGIDLTRREVVLSDAVAGAIQQVRQSAADTLTHTDRKLDGRQPIACTAA